MILPLRALFAAVLASATFSTSAQTPGAPPVPKPALPSAWRIDYTSTATTPSVTSETFRVNPHAAEKVSISADGTTTQSYLVGRYKVFFDPAAKRILLRDLDPSKSEFAQQLFHQEYPGWEWVEPEHFVGWQRIEGKTCAVFREPVTRESGGIQREAFLWNGQPFLIRTGTLTGQYTFLDTPKEVVLPAEFQGVLAKARERRIPPGQAQSISK